jgi:hypothetical protein
MWRRGRSSCRKGPEDVATLARDTGAYSSFRTLYVFRAKRADRVEIVVGRVRTGRDARRLPDRPMAK